MRSGLWARLGFMAGWLVSLALAPAALDAADGDFGNFGECAECGQQGGACSACLEDKHAPICGSMWPDAFLPEARWYFGADLIALRRDATEDQLFATQGILGPPALSTDNLDFAYQAGYRLKLGRLLGERWAIEASYFDLNDWSELAVARDSTLNVNGFAGDLYSPFSDFGASPIADPVVDPNHLVTLRYQSSLDNVELNLRHRLRMPPSRLAVSVLYGFRHNAVRERFGYFTEAIVAGPAAATNDVNVRADNELWGFQIGSLVDLCLEEEHHLEFEIKGAVAHDQALQETVYTHDDGIGGIQTFYGRRDEQRTSFVGEMRLTLVYQFGPHLSAQVGYQAIAITNIALASRNLQTDIDILRFGPPVLNHGGSVIYHGPLAGLVFVW